MDGTADASLSGPLYDAQAEKAYWQYFQRVTSRVTQPLHPKKGAKSVYPSGFPVRNVFDNDAVDYARTKKQSVLDQLRVINHVL